MFGRLQVLHLRADGGIQETEVRPSELAELIGRAPRGFPVGGGLFVYYSAAAQGEGKPRARVTTVQSATGRTRARFYGKTLLCRLDARGALRNIQPADLTIARWLVRVTVNREEDQNAI